MQFKYILVVDLWKSSFR